MRDQPPRDSKKINAENALRKCPQGKLRARSSLRREEEEKAEPSTAASKKRRPADGITGFGTWWGVEKRRRDKDNAETQRTPSRAEERKRLLVKIILTLGGGSCDRTATDFGPRGLRKELIERRVQKKRRIQ